MTCVVSAYPPVGCQVRGGGRPARAFLAILGNSNRLDAPATPWNIFHHRGDQMVGDCRTMATVTKKELIDRIAEREGYKRVLVKRIIQSFLDSIVDELSGGNRLEFRDFGVFESRMRASREAQNPKTMDKVHVPAKRTVKFKVGRVMKLRLDESPVNVDEATGLPMDSGAPARRGSRSQGNGAAS